MKKLLAILLIAIVFYSCDNTWDSETKEMFHQSCMEEANKWANTDLQAKAYCDCVMEITIKKYPSVADYLENVDSVMHDQDFQQCKTSVQ